MAANSNTFLESVAPISSEADAKLVADVESMPHDGILDSDNGTEEVLDPEKYFLDVANEPSNGYILGSGFVPIRAWISDDVDDEYEGDVEEEGSFASSESYDSASERLATDLVSPFGSFVELIVQPGAISTAQKGALRQLNELNSGFSSLNTFLLENTNEEGFRSRVMKIAESKSLLPDDEVIHSILSALLPLVQKKNSSLGDEVSWGTQEDTRVMPVAKPTVDDDDEIEGLDDDGEIANTNEGAFDLEEMEGEILSSSARGLRIRGSDEEAKEEEGSYQVSLSVKAPVVSVSESEELGLECEKGSRSNVNVVSQLIAENVDAEEVPQASGLTGDEDNKELPGLKNQEKEQDIGEDVYLHAEQESSVQREPSVLSTPDSSSTVHIQDLRSTDQVVSQMKEVRIQDERMGKILEEKPSVGSQEQEGEEISDTTFPTADSIVEEAVNLKSWSLGLLECSVSRSVDVGDQKEQANDENFETDEHMVGAGSGVMKVEADTVNVKEEEHMEATPEENVENTRELSLEALKGNDELVAENSSSLAALVSSKSTADPASDSTSLGGAGPSLAARPVGLGRSISSLDHAPRTAQRSRVSAPFSAMESEVSRQSSDLTEGSDGAQEKLQLIRVKFLRLAHRLGHSPHNAVVAQVLYRLGLAEQLQGGRGAGRAGAFSFERASVLAEEQEAAGQGDLEFGCTIMVLGKSGVGKSATINSLFDEVKTGTDAYNPATKKVHEVTGTVYGIKLKVIDTPGLLNSFTDQRHNRRVMASVKHFIKKSPPDIVLYFDRLDMQSRDYGDLPLLQTITDTFGAAVWFNAIVVFTHAASAPPDGANGVPLNYEMFVAQRSHVVQQTIRQAAGDMRLMNPVSLVENHPACRTNRAGQCVLPNGQVWKSQLLLLCFASTILAEANSLLKLQDSNPTKPFGVRSRGPPLPYLLSSLLQSRAQLKLPDEQMDDDELSEGESEEEDTDSDGEEFDDLPPFRRLSKDELKLLDKDQRKIYFEELDYREKLFVKKQLKDEQASRKERRRRIATHPSSEVLEDFEDHVEEEDSSAPVPVPMPDMALPPSFDSDNPTFRYRYLDTANHWLVRPVLETHGWDHDSGYDGLNVEKMFVISQKIPASISGQVTKDKKEASLQMEFAASFKNGDGKVTLTGIDIQTIGKELSYTLRSETRFSNFKRNKTTCGLAVTMLGDTIAAGMKVEDRLMVGRRLKLIANGGALTGRGDVAYGGSLEASFRGKDYPIDRTCSTLGLSIMNWHGDLAIGGNVQSQIQLGSMVFTGRANLNNRGAGQVSIRANSSEQLQIALLGLIPLIRAFINNRIRNKESA